MIGEETIDGEYASWGDLPSGWSSAERPVVDAVPSMADAELENEAADKGSIMRCAVKEIRVAGRNTQGVRIKKLSGSEKVVSVIKIEDNIQ